MMVITLGNKYRNVRHIKFGDKKAYLTFADNTTKKIEIFTITDMLNDSE